MWRNGVLLFTLFVGAVLPASIKDYTASTQEGKAPGPRITRIAYLIHNMGGRVDWLHDSNLIAYDSPNSANFSDVHLMNSDGSNQRCITCSISGLPEYKGNPAWHPSGKYLLFQATDPALPKTARSHQQYMQVTSPGSGWHNNLWLTTPDGSQQWQLTHVNARQGLIHAHFDHSGKRVMWAQVEAGGGQRQWSIKIGDFEFVSGAPQIRNIRSYTPGKLSFYETHSFSPDGTKILFTGKSAGFSPAHLNYGIYEFEISSGSLKALVDPNEGDWNEQSHYTPDGSHIIWMTSKGIQQNTAFEGDMYSRAFVSLKTDYWIMKADGSSKQRLSFFNDPQSAMYIPGHVIASDLSFHTNTELVVYVGDNPLHTRPGEIGVMNIKY